MDNYSVPCVKLCVLCGKKSTTKDTKMTTKDTKNFLANYLLIIINHKNSIYRLVISNLLIDNC